jgi:hypothetical protein
VVVLHADHRYCLLRHAAVARIGDRTGDAGIALGRSERVADLGRILRAGALDGVGDQTTVS